MSQPDIIINLLKYYSKFVPKKVLKEMFIKGGSDRHPGYDEIKTEIMSSTDDRVIPDIDTFVFSMNEQYVERRLNNSRDVVLFVEYGAFSYDPTRVNGIQEKLAIHVVFPASKTNSDNIEESLLMNRMHNILTDILKQMEEDQSDLDFCGTKKLIKFPAEIVPVEPMLLYGRAGWMAIFDHEITDLS